MGIGVIWQIGRWLIGSKAGRIVLVVAALMAAAAAGAVWVSVMQHRAYDRGYAARKAEDEATTAKLQAALNAAQAMSAQQAAQLASAQASADALVKGWVNAVPSGSPRPSADDLRSLHDLWTAARRAH